MSSFLVQRMPLALVSADSRSGLRLDAVITHVTMIQIVLNIAFDQ